MSTQQATYSPLSSTSIRRYLCIFPIPPTTIHSLSARFEHDTLPFLSMIALDHAIIVFSDFAQTLQSTLCSSVLRGTNSHLFAMRMDDLSSDPVHLSFDVPPNSPFRGPLDDPGLVIGLTLFESDASLTSHNHIERLTTRRYPTQDGWDV
jgi:hypothetical protein